jgi:hypothetical protein
VQGLRDSVLRNNTHIQGSKANQSPNDGLRLLRHEFESDLKYGEAVQRQQQEKMVTIMLSSFLRFRQDENSFFSDTLAVWYV